MAVAALRRLRGVGGVVGDGIAPVFVLLERIEGAVSCPEGPCCSSDSDGPFWSRSIGASDSLESANE